MDDYHHSVWHYHSPLPLGHRNRPAFLPERGFRDEPLYPSDAATVRKRTGNRSGGLVDSRDRPFSVSPGRRRVISGPGSPPGSRSPLSVGREGIPAVLPSRTVDLSDHFYGPSMSPKPFNPLAHSGKPLSADESNLAWLQTKQLLFGVHKRRGQPYVTPDEWPDPLRLTRPNRFTAVGYSTGPVNKGQTKARTRGGEFLDRPVGQRRCPAHAVELPVKVNWHDPFHAPEPKSGHRHAAHRLPATPLLEEVDERLRHEGCGSLVDVRFAPDEAIAELLRSCGFGPSELMTILWELRRRYPLPLSG